MEDEKNLIVLDSSDVMEVEESSFETKTVFEVVEEFLNYKNSEQTRRAYKNDIETFFVKNNIHYIRDLSYIQYFDMVNKVLSYINSFKKAEKYHPDRVTNPKTVNRKAYALSSFFKFLINVYNYPKNPVANFIPLKVKKRSTTESLTGNEIIEVIEYTKAKKDLSQLHFRNHLIFLFLFLLALRRNEIANVKWNDIDYFKKSINVFQKGGTYKELPLPENLLKLLKEYKTMCGKKSQYIFTPIVNNRTKTLLKPITTDLIFKIVRNTVSVVIPDKNITPHSFRKTFIEIALNNKQDFISIINATGHTNIEMVKYYDTRDSLINNAINQIGELI